MRAFLLPWIFVMIADLLVECAHFIYLSASQAVSSTRLFSEGAEFPNRTFCTVLSQISPVNK